MWGLAEALSWTDYYVQDAQSFAGFEIPPMSARAVADHVITQLGLKGVRMIGDPETTVRRIRMPRHMLDDAKPEIRQADRDGVDMFWAMELIDFNLAQYVRDASQLGQNKVIMTAGHFNAEASGMRYMATWLPDVLGPEVPVHDVPVGDTYQYITAGK